jgi:hypothetical protein
VSLPNQIACNFHFFSVTELSCSSIPTSQDHFRRI